MERTIAEIAELGREAGRLEREGHYSDAEKLLRAAHSNFPESAAIAYALGILLLRLDRSNEGWQFYEARHWLPGNRRKPKLSFPEWKGEQIQSLLILPEQGLGDQIMFSRYVELLKKLSIEITLVCSSTLARLFSHLGVRIISVDGEVELDRYDAWTMIGSIPRILGNSSNEPYLFGSKTVTGGIGVIVSGNSMPDPNRTLDEKCAAELLALPRTISLLPQDTGARDFQDTADIVAGLDLVISIDTAGAHLAGAMGKTTLLLLPIQADWRWGIGQKTRWYPSMTAFRQPVLGDWKPVIDDVKRYAGL